MPDVLIDLARSLMFFFDNIIYGLIPTIYKLFVYLSEVDLFTGNTQISNLVNHIYALLGIFMLFKVSFSLLQYIVDPNSFRDSSKGMGKLITNVLVALVLLVSVPSIFSVLMEFQTTIVQSNAIGRLILGTNTTGNGNEAVEGDRISVEGVNTMAKDLQFMIYGAFYSIDSKFIDSNSFEYDNGGILSNCEGTTGILGSTDMAIANNGQCLDQLAVEMEKQDDISANGVNLYSFYKYVNEQGEIVDERDFNDFGRLLTWKQDGVYVINYLPLISAAAGIYIVFLLISFSVDVAVRAIKLCFLQMVAPIAIVSYVDPKESVSNGKLHNWVVECSKTYFSLFLRLATIFLVMFVISAVASTVISSGSNIKGLLQEDPSYNIWIYLFLVLGAFMFAKQVPNIIESIFGIKFSGDLHLNPFKNEGLATLTGGVVGAGIGGVASSIASAKTASIMGDNKFKAALSGFTKGTLGGAFKGKNWDGKNLSSLISTPLGVSGDIARYQAAKHGTRLGDRAGAMINEAIGAPQKADIMKKRIENAGRFTKLYDAVDGGVAAKMAKLKDISQFTSSDPATNRANFKKISEYNYLKAQLDAAIQRGDAETVASIQNGSYSDSVITSSAKFSDYEDEAKQTMYDMITRNEIVDDAEIQSIRSNIDAMKRVGKENASTPEFASVNDSIYVNDGAGKAMSKMKKASKAVNTAKTVTENSDEYENSQAAADAIKSNRMFDYFTKR